MKPTLPKTALCDDAMLVYCATLSSAFTSYVKPRDRRKGLQENKAELTQRDRALLSATHHRHHHENKWQRHVDTGQPL